MNTPTPWAVSEDAEFQVVDCNTKKLIADTSGHLDTTNGEAYDNAALIVRAVNSHEALVAALEAMTVRYYTGINELDDEFKQACAALALAKEPQ